MNYLLDIDGCVLSTKGDVSPSYYRALAELSKYIHRANQRNLPAIMFCTGRDRNYVEAVSFMVGLPNAFCVIEGGIGLFNPTTKELLYNPALTPDAQRVFKEISQKRIPLILKQYPEMFLYPGNMVNVAIERKYGASIPIEKCYEVIKTELADFETLIEIHYFDSAVDISPAGIDKASGIRFLSDYTGLNLNSIAIIGDSDGDRPAMLLLKHIGCPSNTSDTCKELVRGKKGYVSSFPYIAGVIDIIAYMEMEKK